MELFPSPTLPPLTITLLPLASAPPIALKSKPPATLAAISPDTTTVLPDEPSLGASVSPIPVSESGMILPASPGSPV
jgi:hypothetical protein